MVWRVSKAVASNTRVHCSNPRQSIMLCKCSTHSIAKNNDMDAANRPLWNGKEAVKKRLRRNRKTNSFQFLKTYTTSVTGWGIKIVLMFPKVAQKLGNQSNFCLKVKYFKATPPKSSEFLATFARKFVANNF